MYNLDFVNQVAEGYQRSVVDESISDNDLMANQWYFEVGRSAVEVILAAMFSSYIHSVNRVLDLPCGHGRVLRHLVKMFPQAEMHACDLDTDGVDYCARRFNAKPIVSVPDLTMVDFGVQYDLIWVGSLFTHVAESHTKRWLAHLANFLSPSGIVVATMHGRWSEHVNLRAPYIGAERWANILKGYNDTGYGYSDYVKQEASQYTPDDYGISMARPHAMLRLLESIPNVRIFSYMERAWADHQDVMVYGKPAYDTPWA